MRNFIFYLLVFIISAGFIGITGIVLCMGFDVCISVGSDMVDFAFVLGVALFVNLCVYFYRNFIR